MVSSREIADRAKDIGSADDLDKELVRRDRQIAKLKGEVTSLRSKYKHAISELDAWEKRSEILEALEAGGTDKTIRKLAEGSQAPSTAILCMSDWHVEEEVRPDLVNGLNEYNLDIAARRVERSFQKGLELIDSWRRTWPIDVLVLAVLGDLISGYIHEELVENNFLSPTEASLFAQEHLHAGIQFLKKEGGVKKIIVPTCFGNHGRTTRKRRIASGYKNSYEWLMYSNMEIMYRQDPQVEWVVGKGYHNLLDLQGVTVRLHHGDGLRYQGGVGGITVPVNKKIAAWNQSRPADLDIFGHWHQFVDHWNWVCGGCLIGFNPYAIEIGASYQPPTQTLVMVSRNHGKVAALPVLSA